MSESGTPFLSPVQRRIVAAGGTALAAVILLVTAFFFFDLLRRFVGSFQDVLLPLAIAAILATLLRPIITFLETRTRLGRTTGIVLLFLLVILLLGVIAVFIVPALFDQITTFIKEVPTIVQNVLTFSKERFPSAWTWLQEQLGESPEIYIKELIENNSNTVRETLSRLLSSLSSFTGIVGGVFGKIAAYSVIPIYLFFILSGDRDVWKDVEQQLNFLPDSRRDDLVFLARQFSDILVAFFRGQLIIGLLLGVVLAIGFTFIGLKFGFVLGFVLGLLNIIPYLGTVIGLATVLPLAYFQNEGGLALVAWCLLVFIIGQLLTDYVFTPRVMGDKTGMGPMLIIFSIFFWGSALGGILGMVLAIPLTAFFLVFWRLAREKYIPLWISSQTSTEDNPA
ncbi:MAG: AI-2E family transporter [Verrucomicrobiota bacterium]